MHFTQVLPGMALRQCMPGSESVLPNPYNDFCDYDCTFPPVTVLTTSFLHLMVKWLVGLYYLELETFISILSLILIGPEES